jgi:hypothetical protein
VPGLIVSKVIRHWRYSFLDGRDVCRAIWVTRETTASQCPPGLIEPDDSGFQS